MRNKIDNCTVRSQKQIDREKLEEKFNPSAFNRLRRAFLPLMNPEVIHVTPLRERSKLPKSMKYKYEGE